MSIDIDDVKKIIKNHLEEQPYKITCSSCGIGLSVAGVNVDEELDLSIEVEPCSKCIEDAIDDH